MTTITAGDAVCSYGNVEFPGHSLQTLGIDVVPVQDPAKRTVSYSTYTITLKAIFAVGEIAGATSTDDTMEDLRITLTKPCQILIYEDKGFGFFQVNTGRLTDVKWGPFPKVLSWKPIGNDQACEVVWKVEVALMECDANGSRTFSKDYPLEFNYKVGYNVDQEGYSRRNYSGHITVAQNRQGADVGNPARTLTFSADEARDKINPTVPNGFRRTQREFNLSEDKCRLDFSIVDEQLPPNILPADVVLASANHTITSDTMAFVKWNGTITADYTMAFEKDRPEAVRHFGNLIKDRIENTKNQLAATKGVVLPVSLQLQEPEIYGRRTASFTFNYRFTLDAESQGFWDLLRKKGWQPKPLETLLKASSLWREPPDGSNWAAWSTSMNAYVFAPRGHSGLKFQANEDAIVDLCILTPTPSATLGNEPAPSIAPPKDDGRKLQGLSAVVASLMVKGYEDAFNDPAKTWLDYDIGIQVEPIDNVAECELLPTSAVQYLTTSEDPNGTTGYQVPYAQQSATMLAQYRAYPAVYVTLYGQAARANYSITPPRLLTVGGLSVVPANLSGNGFQTKVNSTPLVPVVVAKWSFRYRVVGVPGTINSPANIVYGSPQADGVKPVLSGFVVGG